MKYFDNKHPDKEIQAHLSHINDICVNCENNKNFYKFSKFINRADFIAFGHKPKEQIIFELDEIRMDIQELVY